MMTDYSKATPRQVRRPQGRAPRRADIRMAEGYVQANLAVLPGNLAYDFLLFCTRNLSHAP